MAQELLKSLREVNNQYETVIEKVKEAFVYLKQEKLSALKECNEDITWTNHDLVKKLNAMTKMIDQKCEEKNVGKKIQELVRYYSVEEKELILAEFERAIRNDREYKMQLLMYRNLMEIKKDTLETIVELWTDIAREEGIDGQMFVNQKF